MKMSDTHHYGGTGMIGTFASIILYAISRFALTDLAAIMTIIVAGTTAALNIQKFVKNRREKDDA